MVGPRRLRKPKRVPEGPKFVPEGPKRELKWRKMASEEPEKRKRGGPHDHGDPRGASQDGPRRLQEVSKGPKLEHEAPRIVPTSSNMELRASQREPEKTSNGLCQCHLRGSVVQVNFWKQFWIHLVVCSCDDVLVIDF